MWNFNLEGIQDMYESYEASNLWPFITDTAQGLRVHFVKAEHSTFRWAGQRAAVAGWAAALVWPTNNLPVPVPMPLAWQAKLLYF